MMYRCIPWLGVEVSHHSYSVVEGYLVLFGQRTPASQLGIILHLLSSVFELLFFHNRIVFTFYGCKDTKLFAMSQGFPQKISVLSQYVKERFEAVASKNELSA